MALARRADGHSIMGVADWGSLDKVFFRWYVPIKARVARRAVPQTGKAARCDRMMHGMHGTAHRIVRTGAAQ